MITNWDLVSRIEKETGNTRFSLLIDGTESDARVIAKKLAGVAKAPVPAQSPFVYAFELPNNLDEATQDKIRTAMREGVDLANKVNQFVPGGMLGDPLFNNETAQENNAPEEASELPELVLPAHQDGVETFTSYIPVVEKTASQEHVLSPDTLPEMVLPAHEEGEPTFTSFIPATQMGKALNPLKEWETDARNDAQEAPASLEEVFSDPSPSKDSQTPFTDESSNKQQTTGVPLDEKDMLIKDMEGTVLDRMPIDDIFAAETKYDMFVDVNSKDKSQHTQEQRENKLNEATPAQDNSTFDIFAQNLKEQTGVIDVTALQKEMNQPPAATDHIAETESIRQTQQPPATSTTPQPSPLQGEEELHKTTTGKQPVSESGQPQKEETVIVPLPQQGVSQSEQDTFVLGGKPTSSQNDTTKNDAFLHTVRSANPMDGDLPEITLRQKTSIDLSEAQSTPKPVEQRSAQPTDSSIVSPTPAAQKTVTMKIVKKLRRKESMEEKNPKTSFRIKLKKPSPQAPVPPAPSAPKPAVPQPGTPSKPTTQDDPSKTRTTTSRGSTLEKTRTIDHSIQVSLSELKKHNWPLEVPLVPTYTLSNMVMSVNRFAHATAISVIESPGKLYNPLVLHGPTGTGKSHFLNAMAYAFSQKFGQANIFMTNGVRLSRGIQRYIMEGNINKFDQFMSTVKVILIDDIHLLAINEQNRAYISKLLNTFLKEQKQIVITSKYPPESLEKLEELIKFRLDSGWISELKSPTGQVQFKITKKMLMDNHVDLTDSQITDFFSAENMTLGTVQRSIRRLKVLENLLPQSLSPQQRSAGNILEKLLASQGEDETSHILTVDPEIITSITSRGNGEWGRIGFFYPSNCSDKMNWMVYSLQERARELGIEGGPEIAVRSSYATENIISSAFKIANLCDNKKLKGAVILGPQPGTYDPSVRENFYDILTHMLEVMLIRCGIINFESIRQPSMYVKVLAELMR